MNELILKRNDLETELNRLLIEQEKNDDASLNALIKIAKEQLDDINKSINEEIDKQIKEQKNNIYKYLDTDFENQYYEVKYGRLIKTDKSMQVLFEEYHYLNNILEDKKKSKKLNNREYDIAKTSLKNIYDLYKMNNQNRIKQQQNIDTLLIDYDDLKNVLDLIDDELLKDKKFLLLLSDYIDKLDNRDFIKRVVERYRIKKEKKNDNESLRR